MKTSRYLALFALASSLLFTSCEPLQPEVNLSATQAARMVAAPSVLLEGGLLRKGQSLRSSNFDATLSTGYVLTFQQDGNLVLYGGNPQRRAIWSSNTAGKGAFCKLELGGLYVYGYSGKRIWNTGRGDITNGYLMVENTGNVAIYDPSGAWSLVFTNPENYNIKLNNIQDAFNTIRDKADKVTYSANTSDISLADSHIQGIAYYGDYAIFTHSNDPHKWGKLIIINRKTNKKVHNLDINLSGDPKVKDISKMNHPGGTQIIGNFLVVPVEPSYNSNKNTNKSVLLFYDLTKLNDNTQPTLLDYPRIYRDSDKAGAVGITNHQNNQNGKEYYDLAVYDNSRVDIYSSNEYPITDPRLKFTYQKRVNFSSDGICLVTDLKNTVNIVGFNYVGIEDHLCLFNTDGTKLLDRHFYNKYGSTLGSYGVHFRWGSGLQLLNSSNFQVMCTQRNFVGGSIPLNEFRPN